MGTRFEIAELPLVTWRLYKLADDQWSLLQVEHHFAHDGWSASLLLREVRDAYRALAAGRSPAVPALAVQYRDYARWHEQWATTSDYAAQADYWLANLDGCPAAGVTFEPDRPRPPRQGFKGNCLRATIPAATVARVDELCERHQVTRFSAFLAAFGLLVWRHTNETDMVIGSAFSNRRQPGTGALLGMFVNALPLRLRIDDEATVGAAVGSVMATIAAAQDHQELPLVELIRRLGLPRDPARNALFSLMFAFHDSPRPRFEADGLTGDLWIEHNGSAKNDLNVVCVPNPPAPDATLGHDGLSVLWEYDQDLFDPSSAQRLLDGFLHVVDTLADSWDQPLHDAGLLAPAETARVLDAGHGQDATPPFTTLHAGVDAAIRVDPDATAVIHGEMTATYQQLHTLALAIQDRLARSGVGPGDVVGVACPKSVQLVATYLAVLRAGAAYVCFDHTQPGHRLQFLAADTDPTIIVATSATRPQLEKHLAVPVLDLDNPTSDSGQPARELPSPPESAKTVAYLTYTSGSTGAPKAVVTTHANAVTALHARTTYFGNRAPRALVTLPAIFDVAGSMIFWTLWLGGTVVFPDDETAARDPDRVRDLVERHRVTHVNFTASYYRQFLAALTSPWQAPLRVVAIGGEAPSADIVALHGELLAGAELHNEYGPTEATVWCAASRLHGPGNPPLAGPVTIGRPLANCSMFVLDRRQRPAPVGAVGELYIGGAGVAPGYLGRPWPTTTAFFAIDDGPLAGMRLYRTGDRARLLADGRFLVTGRLDGQIKLRGYRIEPGEVEQCLTSHPAVTGAAVVLRDEPAQLVGYILPHHQAAPDPAAGLLIEELERWVAERLPAYMAPSAYVVLDEIPVTPSGKLDRARLPGPHDTNRPRLLGAAPANQVESQLLDLFRSVLGRPGIGVDDDFFSHGGDSLQAITLTAQARAAGLELPVSLILQARTVRALAAVVDHRSTETPIIRRPAGTPVPLTPIQAWFFDQGFAEPHHFNQASLFEIDPEVASENVRAALGWVLARHDAFRTRFLPGPSGATAALTAGSPEAAVVPEATLTDAEDCGLAERIRVVLGPLHADLDIHAGPLVRAAVINDPRTSKRWLGLVIHHLLVDAVSWTVIGRDLNDACARLVTGQALEDRPAPGVPDRPPAPPTPAELDYWTRLADAPKPTALATTDPVAFGRLRHTERRLSPHATSHLLDVTSRLYHATPWSMLLAALAAAIAPITGSGDLYTWIEGHGRDGLDQAGQIVGWLTSLYPVLLRPGDAAGLAERATRLHRQLAEVPHGGANFGRARYLDPGSPLGRAVADLEQPALTVNYLGHTPAPTRAVLCRSPLPTGDAIGPANVLPTPLHITAATPGGSMVLRCSYDPGLDAVAIESACDRLAATLEQAARLVELTDQPTKPGARPHFFVHPVGGRVDCYGPLARQLASRWRCYGLPQATTATTIEELAAAHTATITALGPAGPYALTGWSFGAIVAYETARQLKAQGRPPTLLTLLDPPEPAPTAETAAEALTTQLASVVPDLAVTTIRAAVDDTARTSEPARPGQLTQRLGINPATARSTVDQITLLVANHAAFAQWRPAGTVTNLQVIIPSTAAHSAAATAAAWQPHSRRPVTVTTVTGDHHTILLDDTGDLAATLERAASSPAD
jgi:amino acid adenylation domain-containing protein